MLRNVQHTSGNWPLKRLALGSADKYTTLLPLAWPIKRLFAKFSLVSDFFRSKKSVIQSYFFIIFKQKKLLRKKKFPSGKPALRSSISTRIL